MHYQQQHNLGHFRKKYPRLFFLSPWWSFTWVVAFLLILLVPVVQGLIQGAVDHTLPPFPSSLFIWMGGMAVVLLIIIYTVLPPGMNILKEWREGTPIALLYEHGFMLLTSKGNEQMVAHWSDIDVWHGVEQENRLLLGGLPLLVDHTNIYTVVKRTTQESMKLLYGAEFNMAVELAVATRQYQSAQAAYQSGQTINFGRLSVSWQGFYDTTTNATLMWGDVARITIDQAGMVRIKQHGHKREWAVVTLGHLANMATLYRLLTKDVPQTFSFQNQARIV